MHIKYCKAILCVHRKSTNFAVLFELGRNPLYHKIIKAMLNYWFRLGTLNPSFVLLNEAYSVSKSFLLHNNPSWFASIYKVLGQLSDFKSIDLSKQKYLLI